MSAGHLQTTGWRMCVPAVALTTLLVGCSMPGKNPLKQNNVVTTASYQQLVVDEGPPKKIKDPLSLKLRYAKWMEEIENYEAAQANYQVVLQERPEDIEAILGLARIDQAAGRLQAAEAGYKKALGISPDSPAARNALGQYYVARDRLPEALPLLSDAMMADPTNKTYRFHLAVALARSGDTTAALPHFVQAVGEPIAYYNVGMILNAQGQYAQAEQHLLHAIHTKPDFEAAKQAVTQIRRRGGAAATYASGPQPPPQIQPAGHSRPAGASAARQQPRHRR